MLKYIYTFFIGILLVTFIGVGIAAFYEGPKPPEYSANDMYVAKPDMNDASSAAWLEADRARTIKQDAEYKEFQAKNRLYSRNVSVITTIAAVIILVISLTMLKKLDLLSDGLLMGGLFTEIYSIIRGFESQDNKFRFVVVTIGLIISLLVGYLKFIKPQPKNPKF